MNEAQTLALIHAVAWPILILLLSKMWNYMTSYLRLNSTMNRGL